MIKKNGGIFGRNPTYNDVVVEGTLTMKEAQVFDNDITINGDLTVNGTETVINTVEFNNEAAGVIRLAQSFGYFPTNQGGSSYVGRVRLSSFR
jgi:hypothetical protein